MSSGLIIRGRTLRTSIVQGGMGVGVSGIELVVEVNKQGGLGTLSSAFMDRVYYLETGKRISQREAAEYYVRRAKEKSGGYAGINIMVALSGFEESMLGAIKGGVDFIAMGAGLPLNAPEIAGNADVALIPIVSSGRALRLVCQRWYQRYKRLPDAAILEGPLAGGHLGFKPKELSDPKHSLENIFPDVLEVAKEYGEFPIIVAGGLYTYDDILFWSEKGARGFQFGTRFLATKESGASEATKEKIVACSGKDIVIAHNDFGLRQSPAGYPFRVLANSPGMIYRPIRPRCEGCPILREKNGKNFCPALADPQNVFCIGAGLLAAIGYGESSDSIITVGANAFRVKEILTVEQVFKELTVPQIKKGDL